MYHPFAPKARDALTRIEAVIVVAMIVVAVGCLLPLLQNARMHDDNSGYSSNSLKQIALASINYADQNNGTMPTGRTPDVSDDQLKDGFVLGPCLYQILPQMDNDPLWKAGQINVGDVHGYAAWMVTGKSFTTYQSTWDPTYTTKGGRTSYLANELALPLPALRYPDSYSDGPAQTIIFAEAHSLAITTVEQNGSTVSRKVKRHWWDKPVWTPARGPVMFEVDVKPGMANAALPQGFRKKGIIVALGDGSVRPIAPRIKPATFYSACTPASNDELGNDW